MCGVVGKGGGVGIVGVGEIGMGEVFVGWGEEDGDFVEGGGLGGFGFGGEKIVGGGYELLEG